MNDTTKQVRVGNSSGKTGISLAQEIARVVPRQSAALLASVLAAAGEPLPVPAPSTWTPTPTPSPDRREAAETKRARRAARNLANRGGG